MVKDYARKITHDDYYNPEKLKKYYHRVEKRIHHKYVIYEKTRRSKKSYEIINKDFIVTKGDKWGLTLIGGGISLTFVLGLLFLTSEPLSITGWTIVILGGILSILFIIYGYTQPKKEHILNRKDGLITMNGFLWQKNITMKFDKVEFAYSTGGEDVIGAFQLQVIRPNKWQTFDLYHMLVEIVIIL